MNEIGARVRLVKGAYKEPASVAHQRKEDVNSAFVRLARQLLDHGASPAIATHDEQVIDQVRAYTADRGIRSDRFEFQMLYGIRRDLQAALVQSGYRMRVYVPFAASVSLFIAALGDGPPSWFASALFASLNESRSAHADILL